MPAQAQAHPKLIVVVIVDQMRADYLHRFARYEHGGLHFFAATGADFLDANYEHIPTETCPGHSVLLSGRNPVHTGMVANDWYERTTGRMVYCVGDPESPLTGGQGAGVSPRNFLGDNFADWLQSTYPGARVFSISLKDRAAILLAGHHPQGVFWFSHDTGGFITSRYYADQLPAWLEQFNGMHADSFAGKEWTPLLGAASPAYHTRETVGHFPHAMPKQAGRDLYDAVYQSPFGDELLASLAETTAEVNGLGENVNGAPDLLAISFSSNDAIGHAFGPDSPEIADEQIRLDRIVGRMVEKLGGRLGARNILWALSADHGSEPTPEAEKQLHHNNAARRLDFSEALGSIQTQLSTIFRITTQTHWFSAETDSMLYFDTAELAQHDIALAAASQALATQVHDVTGIDGFYDPAHLDTVQGWIGRFLRNSAFPGRSGDVYYLTSEWTLFSSKPTGTSHGDPWPYDTHVPMILAGWHIQAKRISRKVQVVDLAPTLADLVGVHWPSQEVVDGVSRKSLVRLR
jgi:predicted AlkP superfamily pyrophosphatase or phosphodiesterase